MKKFILLLIVSFCFVGCEELANTPVKQTENFFKNYQALDDSVINDLNNVTLVDSDLNDAQKEKYKMIMKKHYQDLTYEIKDETIDGDSAVVTVLINVTDFKDVIDEANVYLKEHQSEFYTNELYDESLFVDYKLKKMEETNKKTKYTVYISLTKINDKWSVNQINESIYDKINGVYG